MVEHLSLEQKVVGSSPIQSNYCVIWIVIRRFRVRIPGEIGTVPLAQWQGAWLRKYAYKVHVLKDHLHFHHSECGRDHMRYIFYEQYCDQTLWSILSPTYFLTMVVSTSITFCGQYYSHLSWDMDNDQFYVPALIHCKKIVAKVTYRQAFLSQWQSICLWNRTTPIPLHGQCYSCVHSGVWGWTRKEVVWLCHKESVSFLFISQISS